MHTSEVTFGWPYENLRSDYVHTSVVTSGWPYENLPSAYVHTREVTSGWPYENLHSAYVHTKLPERTCLEVILYYGDVNKNATASRKIGALVAQNSSPTIIS